MDVDSRTHPRKQLRYEIRVPVKVSGIDKDGHYFSVQTRTVNGSLKGIGLLLERELYPFTTLVVSIPYARRVLQIQTEVRHVTPFEDCKKLVGVRIHKIAVV